MNLIEPQRTAWDLQFSLAGIPVRIHPLFWLMALLITGLGSVTGINLVLGIVIVFASILIHELGHAVTMLFYGERPRVVLYMMGGLAISGGDSPWDAGYSKRGRTPQQQIIISFAGPLAGFVLAILTAGVVYALGGMIFIDRGSVFPFPYIAWPRDADLSYAARFSMGLLLYINIVWGVMNLLPVYPLDGGQIAQQLFLMRNPYEGLQRSLWLSLIVGGIMAVLGLMSKDFWIAILFGSLAFGSWQMLQNTGYGGRGW